MRKQLLFLFIVIATCAKSQVVFCPPGAVWHYNFKFVRMGPVNQTVYINEPITYAGDSIFNGENVKVLKHTYFYSTSCANNSTMTFIKQHGDTIFIYNKNTGYTWQILYNFATPVGESWTTTVMAPPGALTGVYNVTVNAVQTATINGIALKQLSTSIGNIIERLGSSNYLFYFIAPDCDGPKFSNFLCYQDNELGTFQQSSKICEYASNSVGLEERENRSGIALYPNPASDRLSIETLRPVQTPELHITDILGKEVLTANPLFTNSKTELDLSTLNTGIYFLKVFDNDKLITTQKIIKD